MDFFAVQRRARRYSALLLVLFTLAVLGLVLAVNLLVGWTVVLGDLRHGGYRTLAGLPTALYGWTTGVTVALIAVTTVRRLWELSAGGPVVARLAGARWVAPDAADPPRRQLLNVSQEIAVACGLAMPRIYLMEDEPGINAFAAGRGPADAVIAVTRGCLERLDRDQLQGVLAHEFSHLLHGDGRLNIRLLGLLHGLTAPGALGGILMRSRAGGFSGHGRYGRGGFPGQWLVGLGLVTVGYTGVLLARVIRAAVSRQREFLADAAAVQFTRNPRGLAGALRVARDATPADALHSSQAEAFSHMLFSTPTATWFSRLLASHPPLTARIARIYPLFQRPLGSPLPADGQAPAGGPAGPSSVASVSLITSVGQFDAANLGYAVALLRSIPPSLQEATQTPADAAALLRGLLADDAALDHAAPSTGARLSARELQLGIAARQLGPRFRLPLVDLTLPTLANQPGDERERLLDALRPVVDSAPTEAQRWALWALVHSQLAPPKRFFVGQSARDRDCRHVLWTLASSASAGTEEAYGAACAELGLPALPVSADLTVFDAALRRLAATPLLPRLRLLSACARAVSHDGRLEVPELELLRAIGALLDCPLPPLPDAPSPGA